jgi:hypothetical protein
VEKLPRLQEYEEKHTRSFSSLASRSLDGGIRATIQSFFTLGFSARNAQKVLHQYIFDEEFISEFEPDGSPYFNETMKQQELQSAIHRRKVMYMVVGVRVAHGATVTLAKVKDKGFKAAADVSVTPGGNQLGGSVASTNYYETASHYVQERDFVWAFRLKKCVPPLVRGVYTLDPIFVAAPDMLSDAPDPQASLTQSGLVPDNFFLTTRQWPLQLSLR